ncbi:MAG: RNA methyltransferase [Deltaproteobacteria bacterium]|nr:RNA methyltransferase [Deltaproteobacteria bacterium]
MSNPATDPDPALRAAGTADGAGALARVVVVLVRPRSPGNIGSVVRLCANYGCGLRLVTPNCDPLARDARMFAAGQIDLLEAAPVFADLPSALADVGASVGFSSKMLAAIENPVFDVDAGRSLLPGPDERTALVFGTERDGLAIEEGAACDRLVRLHTPGGRDSLNLSHAVGAVLALMTASSSTKTARSVTARARERLISDWLGMLETSGYFRATPAKTFRPKLAQLVDHMHLDDKDAALLQGMLRTLSSSSKP